MWLPALMGITLETSQMKVLFGFLLSSRHWSVDPNSGAKVIEIWGRGTTLLNKYLKLQKTSLRICSLTQRYLFGLENTLYWMVLCVNLTRAGVIRLEGASVEEMPS